MCLVGLINNRSGIYFNIVLLHFDLNQLHNRRVFVEILQYVSKLNLVASRPLIEEKQVAHNH